MNPTSSQTAGDRVLLLFAPADGGSGDFSRLLFREDDASVPVVVDWDSQHGSGQHLPACHVPMCTVFA